MGPRWQALGEPFQALTNFDEPEATPGAGVGGLGLIKACQGMSKLVKDCSPQANMYKIPCV